MVFAGIFPNEGSEYEKLRDAMLKLKLSDASLDFTPEHSTALGFGFRVGFLGLLHLEIVQERLRREHNMSLVVTSPSVAYRMTKTDGTELIARSAAEFVDPSRIREVQEPWMRVDLPGQHHGPGAGQARRLQGYRIHLRRRRRGRSSHPPLRPPALRHPRRLL
jgi:GTP-binding protein LepA